MTQKKIAIITVHGTGDTATGPDGDKWFQNGSEFVGRVKARLATHGFDATIIPFLWTGANSARARETAARKLVKDVRKHSREHGPLHLIGHSHGGNVTNEAARMLRWRPKFDMMSFLLNPLGALFRGKDKIATVTTVGTPFFRSKLSNAESFGGAAFLFLLIVSTLALTIGGLVLTSLMIDAHRTPAETYAANYEMYATGPNGELQSGDGSPMTEADIQEMSDAQYAASLEDRPTLYVISSIFVPTIVALIFIYPIALSGLARIIRLRRKQNAQAIVHSIWHPNDEAIAFLQRVEKMPLEPFPPGAMWRSSRTAGIVWGVRIVNILVLVGLVTLIAGLSGADFPAAFKTWVATSLNTEFELAGAERFTPESIHPAEFGGILMVSAIVGMPIIFGVVYVITRLLVFGAILELWLRKGLNNTIGGVLKGIAFGRDGDERVGEVATQSHCHGAQCTILEGEVADRMQQAAGGAADKLIEKYRWALFSVGGNDNTALEALATDAMTWDSLIHTTYFDQPEVADLIADYIAAQEHAIVKGDAATTEKVREVMTDLSEKLGPFAPPGLRPPPAEGSVA